MCIIFFLRDLNGPYPFVPEPNCLRTKTLRIKSSINLAPIDNMIFSSIPLPYHFVRTILSNTILSVYHFVHSILSVPFCPLPFCPVTDYSRRIDYLLRINYRKISCNSVQHSIVYLLYYWNILRGNLRRFHLHFHNRRIWTYK